MQSGTPRIGMTLEQRGVDNGKCRRTPLLGGRWRARVITELKNRGVEDILIAATPPLQSVCSRRT
jgi:hypothetical protein